MKNLLLYACCLLGSAATAATNLVSNTAIVTNRVQGIVTYTMSNGVARVQDPSGKLIGTAEERALKVAADGQIDIASAAADAAGTAMEEWRTFTATTDVKVVYIDAGFTQDLPALAPNLCGWVAGSFYDREKGEDHYYVWFNREIDYPPSMAAQIRYEGGTNWADAAWVDWAVTNWIDKATGREVEWRGAGKYSAEVEYIESTIRQLIDTGLNADSNLGINIKMMEFGGRFGAWCGGTQVGDIRYHSYDDKFGFYLSGYGRYLRNVVVDISVNMFNSKLMTVDGLNSFNLPTTEFDLGGNFYLFSRNSNNGAITSWRGRVYLFKATKHDMIKIDLIPVRFTNENGVSEGAMYDRVSGQLFRNSGAGAFIIGPDTAAPVPCRELVVPRRNANCVLKTGTVITLGGKDGFDADIHKVNVEINGTPTPTASAQLPLFYAVTRSGTNTVTRAYTNGFVNVENGFVKEPTNE